MRTAIALAVALAASPTFASPPAPAPPLVGIEADTEVELPTHHRVTELSIRIVPRESLDDDPHSSCSLTQGTHRVESAKPGDWDCSMRLTAAAGFTAGAVTLQARTQVKGVWSEPSSVQLQLVAPGTLWAQTALDTGAIATTMTPTGTLAHGKLSFPLFTQNINSQTEPQYPFLGRIEVAIPASGSGAIDQVVPIEPRWLALLAKSQDWKALLGAKADKLLAAKALHVKGTYSPTNGAELDVAIPGVDTVPSSISLRPAGYKVQASFINCERLTPAQRREHPICDL